MFPSSFNSRGCSLLIVVLLVACGDDTAPADAGILDAGSDASDAADVSLDAPLDLGPPPPVIGEVTETRRIDLPGLQELAYVVYTENHVPHVYAANRQDAARVLGFVMGRDRFFFIDLARRLSLGTVSELFGADGLGTDIESRGVGMRRVAERIEARWTDEQTALIDAYAEGLNAYIDAVASRAEEPPSEYKLASVLFGLSSPVDMMSTFDRSQLAGVAASVTYQLGFETGDVGRASASAQLDTLYDGEALASLRTLGAIDAFNRVTNSNGYATAGGWGLGADVRTDESGGAGQPDLPGVSGLPVPRAVYERLIARLDVLARRFGHDDTGFGSNAWAVTGSRAADGRAILASDGHLPGTIPSFFYRGGIDTRLLGETSAESPGTEQIGLFVPGLPYVAVGTNGNVAWSQTQLFGDITDWYREEVVLSGAGEPMSTRFEGGLRPLERIDESYEIAEIAALGSVAATEVRPRFVTADGRPITSIEGRRLASDEEPAAGEFVVNMLGDRIVPGDMDDDGVVTAISFDYTGLDGPNFLLALDAFGHAETVAEMTESAGYLVAYSQNIVAADKDGDILYLPYQAVPCREHLTRNADRTWQTGADPRQLIDGTQFGSFELPLAADGRVDESLAPGDTSRCVVPQEAYPSALSPASERLVNSNNDPGTMAQDNSLTNDPFYIGGPWHEDFRATRIDAMIDGSASPIGEDGTETMQADIRSPLGALLVPLILESIEEGRTQLAASPAVGTRDARIASIFRDQQTDLERVESRLRAWRDGGFRAHSGVETFYNSPTATTRANAVATMIFNVWHSYFRAFALGDERLPGGVFSPTGSGGRMRVLTRMIQGRGPANPLAMVDYNPATEESVFFDILGTDEVENANEITLRAIVDALTWLRSDPTGAGAGGFGNDDWDSWLWGYRHHFRLDSVVGEILGGESFAGLVEPFSITPANTPLLEGLADSDPRASLPGFPRHGDNFVVDAANSGTGRRFTFSSVPVMRMIITPNGDQTTGRNIIPGGQSGLNDSEFFSDQARQWLANESSPMRLTPVQVVAGATGRETFVPAAADR